jgi:hypothetical protein
MTNPGGTPALSSGQLIRGVLMAIGAATIVLVVAVLPAEYGIDVTGVGERLGLMRPAGTSAPALAPGPQSSRLGEAAVVENGPFRTDELSISLEPGDGAEIKAFMSRGRRFVYTWTATAPVSVDMHGEPLDASPGEFTSYLKQDDQASGHGAFEAPFDGTHGWFWENLGPDPVTVTVKTSGFYDRLARP